MGRTRTAFTLIEMLVVMTVGMTVMMLAVGMISKSMQIASDNQSRMDQSLVTDRLAREFRRDTHQSTSFELDAGIRFSRPDGSVVEYTASNSDVVRRHIVDDATIAQESFDLGDDRVAVFESSQTDRVALTIQVSASTVRIDRRVEAVVGRWTILDSDEESSP